MGDQLIKVYAISMPGQDTAHNRDNLYLNGKYIINEQKGEPFSYSCSSRQQIQIYAVCDGAGEGEEASVPPTAVMQVLKVLQRRLFEEKDLTISQAREMIADFVTDTNNKIGIYKESVSKKELKTTFAALFIFGNKAFTVHIGDSRLYAFQDNRLTQLTEDHLESVRMMRMGILNKAQADVHKTKSHLTRYFGYDDEEQHLEATFSNIFTIGQGDIFVLTTDGVTDYMTNKMIEKIINENNKDEVILGKAIYGVHIDDFVQDDKTLMVLNVDEVMDKSFIKEDDDDSSVVTVLRKKKKKDVVPTASEVSPIEDDMEKMEKQYEENYQHEHQFDDEEATRPGYIKILVIAIVAALLVMMGLGWWNSRKQTTAETKPATTDTSKDGKAIEQVDDASKDKTEQDDKAGESGQETSNPGDSTSGTDNVVAPNEGGTTDGEAESESDAPVGSNTGTSIDVPEIYTVLNGDYLIRIINVYYRDHQDKDSILVKLKYLNNIPIDSSQINIDQQLKMVPSDGRIEYKVKLSDTINSIVSYFYKEDLEAKKFKIMDINNIRDDKDLATRSTIIIP